MFLGPPYLKGVTAFGVCFSTVSLLANCPISSLQLWYPGLSLFCSPDWCTTGPELQLTWDHKPVHKQQRQPLFLLLLLQWFHGTTCNVFKTQTVLVYWLSVLRKEHECAEPSLPVNSTKYMVSLRFAHLSSVAVRRSEHRTLPGLCAAYLFGYPCRVTLSPCFWRTASSKNKLWQ